MSEQQERKIPAHYDSLDNNAWTRANYGLPPEQGDPGYAEARIAELEQDKQHLLGVLEIVREENDKQCDELERTREIKNHADKKKAATNETQA